MPWPCIMPGPIVSMFVSFAKYSTALSVTLSKRCCATGGRLTYLSHIA